MARSLLSLATVAALAVGAFADNVLTLTGDSFSAAVKEHEKLVVEFYAPWCGHCKKLEPEFETAAGELKAEGITLAKVDATEEGNKKLAEQFGVQGFPTLKIFRGSEENPSEYEGPRESKGIVSFLKKQFGPAYKEISSAEDVKAATTPSDDLSVVGVFPSEGDALTAFKAAADALRSEASFVYVTDAKLVKDADGKEAVVLYRDFDEETVKFDGKIEKAELIKWVEALSVPKLPSLDRSPKNKKALQAAFADQKPKVLGVMEADAKDIKGFKDALIAAKDAVDDVHVIYMDPKENSGAMNFFGVDASKTPCVLVHDPKNDAKYNSGVIEPSKIQKFVEDFKAGKIERTIKSADEPESNDGPVKIVTAKSLKSVVDGSKNVLIEFYAPWCGHCKALEPTFDKLGESYKGQDKIVIAKMDATANDVTDDRFEVKGFPSLYFVSDKGEVKKYESGRSLDDLQAYIEKETGIAAAKEPEQEAEEKTDDAQDTPKDAPEVEKKESKDEL